LGLAERGIRASNSRGCFDTAITEWNLAMMVMLTRDVRQMMRNQEAAVWDVSGAFQQEIRGRTVGLWGYGGIGRETARVARQLGMQVHVLTRNGIRPRREIYLLPGTGDPEGVLPHRTFTAEQSNEFLAGLDYLIVAMPLTSSTDGLIGEGELRALPRTAFVLNPARGPIIREEALLRALREGWIAGAALDTHYQYPLPPGHPLWKFPNVILTPHISGSGKSIRFPERLWDLFVRNLQRLGSGQNLLNELTPAELADK
jgi:phosphoglycerate dehydrogenase-like enzyme